MTKSATNVPLPNGSLRLDLDKKVEDFRSYEPAPARVHAFYRLNHANQTRAFVQVKSNNISGLTIGAWAFGRHLSI